MDACPIAVFEIQVVFEVSANAQTAEFAYPVVFAVSAYDQFAVFSYQLLLFWRAYEPIAILLYQVVFEESAVYPFAVFSYHVVLERRESVQNTVFVIICHLPRPVVIPFITISPPINEAICPLEFIDGNILNFSIPFVFRIRSCTLFDPI